MASNSVKGQKKITSSNTMYNAVEYMVRRIVSEMVETSDIVNIDSADQNGDTGPGGYASATPLVCQTDGFGNAIPAVSVPQMKFYRPQAGKAAIIMDPQPGDKGLAIYPKRDSSGITVGENSPKQPSSFRSFSQADGVVLSGILGETPEIWLHLNPVSGDISLSTKAAKIEISCRDSGDIDIKTNNGTINIFSTTAANITSQYCNIDAEKTTITGDLIVEGSIMIEDVENETSVTFNTHTHSGVQSGDGDTGSPNTGS